MPVNTCNDSYSGNVGNQLPKGIVDDSMLCAGYPEGGKDTCGVMIPWCYARELFDCYSFISYFRAILGVRFNCCTPITHVCTYKSE